MSGPPTVGRIIHYYGPLGPRGSYAQIEPAPLAAIVTEVPTHIEVKTRMGTTVPAIGVTVFRGPSQGGGLDYWLPIHPDLVMDDGSYWQWPPRSL